MPRCYAHRAATLARPIGAGLGVDHLRGALELWVPAVDIDPHSSLLLMRDIDGTTVELGFVPIDEHPLELLLGLDAPGDWIAIGAGGQGRAWALDGNGAADQVRFGHVVARSGAWASRWWADTDSTPTPTRGESSGETCDPLGSSGLVDDACRRAFGLPTAPPDVTVVAGLAMVWLDAALEVVAADPKRGPTWAEVAALHPVAAIAPHLLANGRSDDVAAASLELAVDGGWAAARCAASTGRWAAPGTDPPLAGWFDDGSFARWVCSNVAPVDALAEAVVAVAAPRVGREVARALDSLGLAR